MKRNNKLTGQVGEHLVAAILGTKNYYASPYSGNVPGFDITAVNADTLKSFPIQVKTSNGGGIIRTTIDKWAEFSINDDKTQTVGEPLPRKHPELIWVAVLLENDDITTARFFIATERQIQEKLIAHYQRYLAAHSNQRPRSYGSTMTVLRIHDLIEFENNWSLLDKQ